LVGQSLNQTMPSFIPSVTLLLGTLVMMFYNNAILTLVALVSVVIGFAGIVLILGRSQGYFISQQKNLANVNSIAEESYTGQSVLTTINARNQMTETLSEATEPLDVSVCHPNSLSGTSHP